MAGTSGWQEKGEHVFRAESYENGEHSVKSIFGEGARGPKKW